MAYTTSTSTQSVGDVVDITVMTKFVKNGATITERSGNPGYLANKRLLLASLTSGAITLTGYRKDISDSSNN